MNLLNVAVEACWRLKAGRLKKKYETTRKKVERSADLVWVEGEEYR